MRSYGQFCPVAKGAEVFAERWTPLILRELIYGSHRFSEFQQGLPGISQSLLAQRLRSLERDGVLERRPAASGRGWEYYLTPAGEEFAPLIEQLGAWGYRWSAGQLSVEDLSPQALMWFLRRGIQLDALPPRRTVVRFEFPSGPRRLWWLLLTRREVDLCLIDPGFDVDLYVTADTKALAEIYLGRRDLRQAVREGLLEIDGPRDLVRAFPDWIGVSHFTRYARPTSSAVGA